MTYSRRKCGWRTLQFRKTLLQMVNQPAFKANWSKYQPMGIKDSQIAISLLGATGAKALLPTMVIKQCVKLRNEHFPCWLQTMETHAGNWFSNSLFTTKEGYKDPVEGLLQVAWFTLKSCGLSSISIHLMK